MIQIPSLHTNHLIGYVYNAGRNAIRAKAINNLSVSHLPEEATNYKSRADKYYVIKFIKIPFVE